MDFESIAVMAFERADKQLHHGMIAKISREIPNAQALALFSRRWLNSGGLRQGFTRIGAGGDLVQFRIIANTKQCKG
ncbi:MAG: hypothetical protein ACK5NZ_02580, partial [bacterium]